MGDGLTHLILIKLNDVSCNSGIVQLKRVQFVELVQFIRELQSNGLIPRLLRALFADFLAFKILQKRYYETQKRQETCAG